jgi:hypothetical protein
MPDRDPPPRDDVDPERQTHDPVDIPDTGTTYEPQHERQDDDPGDDAGLSKALGQLPAEDDPEAESEGGEE